MKNHLHHARHMTKMAAMPIFGKTFLKFLSRNQLANFDETWYEASETQTHYIVFK